MIEDKEIERELRRYQPAGPPSRLRNDIRQQPALPPRNVWEWVPSLAVMALTILFYVLSARIRAEVSAQVSMPGELQQGEQLRLPADEVLP